MAIRFVDIPAHETKNSPKKGVETSPVKAMPGTLPPPGANHSEQPGDDARDLLGASRSAAKTKKPRKASKPENSKPAA